MDKPRALGLVVLVLLVTVIAAIKVFNKETLNRSISINQESTTPTHANKPTVTTPKFFNEESRIVTSPDFERAIDGSRFRYSLSLPAGWVIQRLFNSDNPINLVIAKDKHILDINSVWLGSLCIFPGDNHPESQYGIFDQYTTINTGFGIARVGRGKIDSYSQQGTAIFSVCQINSNSNDPSIKQWETNTKIGLIQYRVPLTYDDEVVKEMNRIISNISVIDL